MASEQMVLLFTMNFACQLQKLRSKWIVVSKEGRWDSLKWPVSIENIFPSINEISQPIGLNNLDITCYFKRLIQMIFSYTLVQMSTLNYSIESATESAKAMGKPVEYSDGNLEVELSPLQIMKSLLQLKSPLEQMELGDS